MSKHSKRHNIRHKKAIEDAKKGKVYARIGKLIQVAARAGADPSMNPGLATILTKARYFSLPKEIIDKAILKGAWLQQGFELKEMIYEGYGPGGSALLIKTLCDNTNRSYTNVKTIIQKAGYSLGEPGSVARQFAEQGTIDVNGKQETVIEKWNPIIKLLPYDADELEMIAVDLNALDIETEEGISTLTTAKEDLLGIQAQLTHMGYSLINAELTRNPTTTIDLSEEDEEKLEHLIELLEEDEDVDTVYHNAN